MEKLKKQIKNLNKKESMTNTFTLRGYEWCKICKEFNISNQYLFENEKNFFQGGVDLDARGFKKLVII